MTYQFNMMIAGLKPAARLVGPREREARRGRPYVLRLGANESQFGPSPQAMNVLHSNAGSVSEYCDPTHTDLRQAIAGKWGCGIEHVAIGEGVEGLLEVFARVFVNPGDVAVSSRGTYPTLAYYVEALGGTMQYQPYLPSKEIDVSGLLHTAHRYHAKLMYLANPDNPTGNLLSAGTVRQILTNLPAGCVLLLDEAYADFVQDPRDLLLCSEQWPALIRLRSFSKAHGIAGARIGYAIADGAFMRVAERVRQRYGVSKLSQEMAAAAFEDHAFLEHVRRQNAEALLHYQSIAERLGARYLPSHANFLAFDFESPAAANLIADGCEQHDVLVMQPNDGLLSSLIRITTAQPAARRLLEEVLLGVPAEGDPAEHLHADGSAFIQA